jgi:hypothetical protein
MSVYERLERLEITDVLAGILVYHVEKEKMLQFGSLNSLLSHAISNYLLFAKTPEV